VLSSAPSFPSAGARAAGAAALVALWLIALPLHGSAIATAGAELYGPGNSQACDQTTNGPETQCSFTASGNATEAEASASFGSLFAQADAGAEDPLGATAQASASFSSNVIFEQTGTITGTWLVNWGQGGDTYFPGEPGLLAIMGTDVDFMFEPTSGFSVVVPFTYAGGPMAISAAEFLDAESPGSQGFYINLQLVGFSSDYTMLPDVPEPGTLGLTGIALLAGAFVWRVRRHYGPAN
jgi:hypothetical protein